MKRHRFAYLLSICSLLLVGCTENDLLNSDTTAEKARVSPISFSGGHVDHATTRHFSALCEHLPTLGVWGWYNGMSENNIQAFDDQLVAYNADSAQWEYNPLQYRNEGCQYNFFAYAPHQQKTNAEVDIDLTTHMISIKGVTLHGHNLQDYPSADVKEQFAGTPDTDWMVARAGQTATGAAGMDVEFMMQHILGKLNIRIKACPDFLKRSHIAAVTADSIVVGALPSQGDFVQQLAHTPIISSPEDAAAEEWTAHDANLWIRGTHACTLSSDPTYIVESLVIPHHIAASSTVVLYYTYHYADGHTEECRFSMPLADAFTRFVSGYSHTLTFTVCSERIIFEAGANDWERGTEKR